MHWDHVDVIGLIDLQVVPGQKESAFGLFQAPFVIRGDTGLIFQFGKHLCLSVAQADKIYFCAVSPEGQLWKMAHQVCSHYPFQES